MEYTTLAFDCLLINLLLFSEVRVEGLETLDYLDNMQNKERFTEQGDAITFESEVRVGIHFLFPPPSSRSSSVHVVNAYRIQPILIRWTKYISAHQQR